MDCLQPRYCIHRHTQRTPTLLVIQSSERQQYGSSNKTVLWCIQFVSTERERDAQTLSGDSTLDGFMASLFSLLTMLFAVGSDISVCLFPVHCSFLSVFADFPICLVCQFFLRVHPSVQIILSMLVASHQISPLFCVSKKMCLLSLLRIYIYIYRCIWFPRVYVNELVVINFIGKTLPTHQLHFYRCVVDQRLSYMHATCRNEWLAQKNTL